MFHLLLLLSLNGTERREAGEFTLPFASLIRLDSSSRDLGKMGIGAQTVTLLSLRAQGTPGSHPTLGEEGQTPQKPQSSSEGCLCTWVRSAGLRLPLRLGLPKHRDYFPGRPSFLFPPNAQARTPPLGRADTEWKLFSG